MLNYFVQQNIYLSNKLKCTGSWPILEATRRRKGGEGGRRKEERYLGGRDRSPEGSGSGLVSGSAAEAASKGCLGWSWGGRRPRRGRGGVGDGGAAVVGAARNPSCRAREGGC